MTNKTALITGITGQDGALLAQYLLKKNYRIIAPTRANPNIEKLELLSINHKLINFIEYEKWSDFQDIISKYTPNEIYHLAAMSHVGQSHQNPNLVMDVNSTWTLEILKTIESKSPNSKMFFASSCEIFQSDLDHAANEDSQKHPTNPYGISKLSAHLMVEYYRNVKNLFVCNGILFNHESEIRDPSFVSKKICREVARIVKHGGNALFLGNIDAKKDWGYAPDYVKLFHKTLQQDTADDFVISTGELRSVKDMVNCSFDALNYPVNWQGEGLNTIAKSKEGKTVVAINEAFFRPLDNRFLIGDNTKTKNQLKFNEYTPFTSWVKSMTIAEYKNT